MLYAPIVLVCRRDQSCILHHWSFVKLSCHSTDRRLCSCLCVCTVLTVGSTSLHNSGTPSTPWPPVTVMVARCLVTMTTHLPLCLQLGLCCAWRTPELAWCKLPSKVRAAPAQAQARVPAPAPARARAKRRARLRRLLIPSPVPRPPPLLRTRPRRPRPARKRRLLLHKRPRLSRVRPPLRLRPPKLG